MQTDRNYSIGPISPSGGDSISSSVDHVRCGTASLLQIVAIEPSYKSSAFVLAARDSLERDNRRRQGAVKYYA